MPQYKDVSKILKCLNDEINNLKDIEAWQQVVALRWVVSVINSEPEADAFEVRHGRWLPHEFEQCNGYDSCRLVSYSYLQPTCYRCSLCGRIEEFQEPYCNCGAKMDLEGDTE